MSSNPLQRSLSLPELYDLRDSMEDNGAPSYQLDNIDQIITREQQRLIDIAADQYGKRSMRSVEDVSSISATADELADYAEEITTDLRDGRITATEAAKLIASVNRDLNNLRKQIDMAVSTEESAWSEVDRTPEEYRDAIVRRMPSLDRAMRVAVDEERITQRPARRRRGARAEDVSEDDLARGGFPGRRS